MTVSPLRLGVVAAALSLLTGGLLFGAPPQEPEAELHEGRGAFRWLSCRGGNIGLLSGEDGLLMIDAQFQRNAEPVREVIEAEYGSLAGWLVNTHHHGDHTDGNRVFGQGAVVVAHENVRGRMLEQGFRAPALPSVSHADGMTLHFNGEDIELIHLPGAHTDGDTAVWLPQTRVLHTGDVFFQVGYPFIDVASGGNVLGVIEGVKKLLERVPEDVLVVPGHGVATDRADLESYLEMLETVTERVREARAEGLTVADMLDVELTKDFDERWGGFSFVTPERFLGFVEASLDAAD